MDLSDDMYTKESIEKLDREITIPNTKKKKLYYLSHKFKHSAYAFKGSDEASAVLFIKIIPCKSFTDLKHLYKESHRLQEIGELSKTTTEMLDMFEMYMDHQWCLVSVFTWLDLLTLQEVHSIDLPKETRLLILVHIYEISEILEKYQINTKFVLPSSILIAKDPTNDANSIFIQQNSYTIRIPSIVSTREKANSGASLLSLLYLTENKMYDNLEDASVASKDPAIHYLLNNWEDQKRIRQIVQTWKDLILHRQTENSPDILALHSGLSFESSYLQKHSVKKLLELSSEKPYLVYEYLTQNSILYEFLYKCLAINFKNNCKLFQGFSFIIIYGAHIREFKRKASKLGLLPKILTNKNTEQTLQINMRIFEVFGNNNTLTLFQMMISSDIYTEIQALATTSTLAENFVNKISVYGGTQSVDLVFYIGKLLNYYPFKILSLLTEIPYHFLLDKSGKVLDYLLNISLKIKKIPKMQRLPLIKLMFSLIVHMLCIPTALHKMNLYGSCPVHNDSAILAVRGTGIFLVRCNECNLVLCQSCYYYAHIGHSYDYLYYQSQTTVCMCSHKHSKSGAAREFTMPEYQNRVEFIDDEGVRYIESFGQTFATREITTVDLLSHRIGQISYFEVAVLKAANENIVILEDTNLISYHCSSGKLKVRDNLIMKGPRIGSYDIVGIGICPDNLGFLTVNGLIIYPMFNCNYQAKIRPRVLMNHEECEIRIEIRYWLFQRDVIGFENGRVTKLLKLMNSLEKPMSKFKKHKELWSEYLELLSFLGAQCTLKTV